jgi:cell division protein FtsI (penicillin-binding protein 3)
MLREARKEKARYHLIRRGNLPGIEKIRKFPIFNMGKYKGGLNSVQKNKRIMPFRHWRRVPSVIKTRTLKIRCGLEGAYAKLY